MELITQNWFTTIALLSWPLVVLWLYHTRPIGQATIWTIFSAATPSGGRCRQAGPGDSKF